MKLLTIKEIVNATGGRLLTGSETGNINRVSTDSKNIDKDCVFFALKGKNHDGHDFIDDAKNNGCRTFVISKENTVTDDDYTFVLVDDTLTAYQDLAGYYRDLIAPITIGITGSVGKTSLKDMVEVISLDNYNTVCTQGNENNHIGVPKTIFRMEENTEVLILEMGMNHRGEIRRLAEIGKPKIAAITNIGVSHIENFSGQDDIYNAKMEITDHFDEDCTLIVNGDDPYFENIAGKSRFKVISVGISDKNDYSVSSVRHLDDTHITFLTDYDNGIERFTLPVAGLYNSITAAMATAVMVELHIGVINCARSLEKLERTPHRLQLITKNGMKIIDDTYNASPDSMKSGIEYLFAIESKRKMAVLGDMKELGESSDILHRQVGEYAGKSGLDFLFTVGGLSKQIAEGAAKYMDRSNIFTFADKMDCIDKIKDIMIEGDGILVKGSNSMRMIEIVNALTDPEGK